MLSPRFAPALSLLAALLLTAADAAPRPAFYLPLDGTTTAAVAGGSPLTIRSNSGQNDTILELLSLQDRPFVPGQVGEAAAPERPLMYECAGNFRADEGTCSLWFRPDWRGDDRALYSTVFGAADWGMLYKYTDQTALTFGTAKAAGDLYYDCGGGNLSAWQPGQWHHLAVTWSRQANVRRLYADGKLVAQAPFPFSREVKSGPLFVGAGCTLYPNERAHGAIDEFALWDRPLDEAELTEVRAAGLARQALCTAIAPVPATDPTATAVVQPAAPAPPEANTPQVTRSATRTRVSLNGWWQFLPRADEAAPPATAAWGLSRVPGYWTNRSDTLGPDGKATAGQWEGRPLDRCWVARYQRSFSADPAWQGRTVRLHLGGVDGLAAIYLNGKLLGWLPSWVPVAYDIGGALKYGQENTVTLVLRTRGGSRIAGLYDDVAVEITAGAVIDETVVTPHTEPGRIDFSCGLYYSGRPVEGLLEFEVTPAREGSGPAKVFSSPCRLTGAGAQRVAASFDWRDAHRWNLDDPFLYRVTTRLKLGGVVADEAEPQRFGFREFTTEGADFILNGKPVHLRGHQIDLAWANQWQRVLELKSAGMNSLELSGPICSDWYRGVPYQRRLFEDILNYCDENGLIAAPILPDVPIIKDRIFDPAVAALYRQRLEGHVRRYGNHPSIGLWYMNFNLAGYLWYVAPSKIDDTFKPSDASWRGRERYALEAGRIAREVDARPLYHHACGNLGDIVTSNLYLGPNSPTQEREEWPSQWASKRLKPFMAVEHCCMLICYWFRPRQFPLSVVYAGEPIFDEIAAMYLGQEAYTSLTPELFDLYDTGRAPRAGRTMALIQNHPGYQATKSQVARQSLRAWRTYGVTGIFFNAENWDFNDASGRPLPMKQALARSFGDTDLYIAGPASDWPAKDHAYFSGETVSKQVVLLNDLNRDLPCRLRWQVTGAAGTAAAEGTIDAVAKAGTPSFCPLQFTAPAVTARTDLVLTVTPVDQQNGHFQPESFRLQVFPPRRPPTDAAAVVLYDPLGDTARMLQQAGVKIEPLTAATALTPGALLVVGRRAYDAGFLKLAADLQLEQAIRNGLRVVVFEQTAGTPFGLRLEETSVRQTFMRQPGHPALAGLQPADVQDLRGQSDLLVPYPDADPATERAWPARCFKWGNRGIVATYVYDKPHLAPFRPVLECGFDLAQSPLLEARFGRGSVTLCQVDVTPRFGSDPVATTLVDNLLRARPLGEAPPTCSAVGESARQLLGRLGVNAGEWRPGQQGVICVGSEALEATQVKALQEAAEQGATLVLLPQKSGDPFGVLLREGRLFRGSPGPDPLLAGLGASDLYLKSWETLPLVEARDGWRVLVEPGLVACRDLGRGRVLTCRLDPFALKGKHCEAKAWRVWNLLLANLGVGRTGPFLTSPAPAYQQNEGEKLPPYMSW